MLASIAIIFVVSGSLKADVTQAAEHLSKSTSAEQTKSAVQTKTAVQSDANEQVHKKEIPGVSAMGELDEVLSQSAAHAADSGDDQLEGGALPNLHAALIQAHNALGDTLHMGLKEPIHADSGPVEVSAVALKFTKMLQMFAMMHKIVKPVKHELEITLEHSSGKDRAHTEFLLDHVKDLDVESVKVNGFLHDLHHANTDDEKKVAMHNLIQGVVGMKDNLFDNLASLKEAVHPITKKISPFMKMRVVLHKLAKKIKAELTDPKLKNSKQVQLDVKLYDTVKTAVSKAETLLAAGQLALKREPSKHMEMAIHRVMKRRMAAVTATLKTDMKKIKMEREALKAEQGSKTKSEEAVESEESSEAGEKADAKAESNLRTQHGLPLPDPAVEE